MLVPSSTRFDLGSIQDYQDSAPYVTSNSYNSQSNRAAGVGLSGYITGTNARGLRLGLRDWVRALRFIDPKFRAQG